MSELAVWTATFGITLLALILILVLPVKNSSSKPNQGLLLKENHGTKVVVSQAYFWEPIDTAPLGCKVQLKTKPGGVAIYGTVTESNRQHFTDWAPLPTTRKERK